MRDDMTLLRRALGLAVAGMALAVILAGSAMAQSAPTTATPAPGQSSASTTATATPAATAPVELVSPKLSDFPDLNPGLRFPKGSIQFMPEYDSKDLLVIVDYELPDGVQLPLKYQFRIPKGARLTGYALLTPQGEFDYNRPTPKVTPGTGDWDLVDAEVPRDQPVHIEYYYNPGIKLEGQRSFPVEFEVPAAIDQMVVSVQQPARATGFQVTPELAETGTDSQGLGFASSSLANLQPGDRITAQVQYEKPDAEPTVAAGGAESSDNQASQNYLLWLLVAMVVGVGGFIAYRMLAHRQAPARSGSGRAAKSSARAGAGTGRGQQSKGATPASGPQRFCTECGAKLTKKDRFCPQCGHERE